MKIIFEENIVLSNLYFKEIYFPYLYSLNSKFIKTGNQVKLLALFAVLAVFDYRRAS